MCSCSSSSLLLLTKIEYFRFLFDCSLYKFLFLTLQIGALHNGKKKSNSHLINNQFTFHNFTCFIMEENRRVLMYTKLYNRLRKMQKDKFSFLSRSNTRGFNTYCSSWQQRNGISPTLLVGINGRGERKCRTHISFQ